MTSVDRPRVVCRLLERGLLIICLLLFAAVATCRPTNSSTKDREWNISSTQIFSILSIDIPDKNCHTDVINLVIKNVTETLNSQTMIPGFVINSIAATCGPGKCGQDEIQELVFRKLLQAPSELAIIGPVCSDIANAMAQVSRLFQIPLVSFAPFPSENKYLFSLLPSQITLMNAVVGFVESYPEWQRVKTISQDSEVFRIAGSYLERTFSAKNISVEKSVIIPRNLQLATFNINKLLVQSVRIIVLNMDSSLTRALLCKVAVNIDYQYVWITLGFHESWWLGPNNTYCNDNDLQTFLHEQGVLSISNIITRSDLMDCGNDSDPNREQKQSSNLSKTNSIVSLAYDAVTSIALGLKSKSRSNIVSELTSESRGSTFANRIGEVNFRGLTNNICFKNNKLPVIGFQFFQFRQVPGSDKIVELLEVGAIYLKQGVVFNDGEDRESLWESGIPSDGSPVSELKHPQRVLMVLTYIFAVCNILAAIAGMVFMIVFRKRRLIRISSPNLNYLVGIGIIIFNTSVFLFVYPPLPMSTINVFCGVRTWPIAIGYSLCLGTINTKMWRVFYIFRNPKQTSKNMVLKDWHLFLFVAFFLVVDVLLLSFSTSFTASRLQAVSNSDIENPDVGVNEEGFEVEYKVVLCDSKNKFYWLAILLGYKIFLHMIAVVLAFKIRKVKIKVLNDSKEVILILYLTGVVLAAVIIITFAFSSYLNVYSGVFAVGVCATSAVILGVVFVSKALQLYKDPDGANIFPPAKNNAAVDAIGTCDNTNELVHLNTKIRTLQAQLSFYNQPRDELEVISQDIS